VAAASKHDLAEVQHSRFPATPERGELSSVVSTLGTVHFAMLISIILHSHLHYQYGMVHLAYRTIPGTSPPPRYAPPQELLELLRLLERHSQARKPDARGIYHHFFLPFPFAFVADPFDTTLAAREVWAVVVALLPFFTASSCLFCHWS